VLASEKTPWRVHGRAAEAAWSLTADLNVPK